MNDAGENMEAKASVTRFNRTIPRTQKLTGIALFAALAIVLNLIIKIPAPYLPFLYYDLWEVPIVIAFLVFGVYSALGVSVINTIALLLIFPGALPTGPLYNLAAVLFMLLGVWIGYKLSVRAHLGFMGMVVVATGLGIVIRVIGETLVALTAIPQSPPIGFDFPVQAVIPILPLIAFFNATVALYSVPIAYGAVRAVSSRIKARMAYPITAK